MGHISHPHPIRIPQTSINPMSTLLITLVAKCPANWVTPEFEPCEVSLTEQVPVTHAFMLGIAKSFKSYREIDLASCNIRFCTRGFELIARTVFIFRSSDSLTGSSDTVFTIEATLNAPKQHGKVTQTEANALTLDFVGPNDDQRAYRIADYFQEDCPEVARIMRRHGKMYFGAIELSDHDDQRPLFDNVLIHAFTIYGGIALSKMEARQKVNDFTADNKRELIKSLQDAQDTSKQLIEFQRRFLSHNQSMVPEISDYVERILSIHKMRERFEEQYRLSSDISNYLSISYKKTSFGTLSAIQFIIATFTLLSIPIATFFGLFEISTNAEIVMSSGAVLFDQRVWTVLLLSALGTVCVAAIIGAAALAISATKKDKGIE